MALHVGDIGAVIRLTVTDQDGAAVDLSSGLSAKQIKLKPPGASAKTRAASFQTDGTDGVIQYATISGDIDDDGSWWVQGKLTYADGTEWHTEKVAVTVEGVVA